MTTREPCIVVTLLGCVFAVATSAHAESAWMLWQQATVFTERRWTPKGWPAHWRTTEMPPVALSEFQTLADCQLAQTQAMSRDADLAREVEAKATSGARWEGFAGQTGCRGRREEAGPGAAWGSPIPVSRNAHNAFTTSRVSDVRPPAR